MSLSREQIERLIESLEEVRRTMREQAEHFADIETLCLFVGYPKSGHSLVGALLDAHPDMVIAHELDFLRGLRAGLGREALYALLLETSRGFMQDGHLWNGYRYKVKNQWQGRFRRLKVIGDKKGGSTSRQLLQYPRLLERLYSMMDIPIQYVHVTRHPGNNILGISREFDISLEQAAEFYFAEAEAVAQHKTRVPADSLFELRYESFIREPEAHLAALCDFLGQEAPKDYLHDCAAIVEPAIQNAKAPPVWPPGLWQSVAARAARFEFLAEYRFD